MKGCKENFACHVNWVAPVYGGAVYSNGNVKNGEYTIDDLEVLTTILSIAAWQKWHGRIHLFCDDIAASYYAKIGILELWDSIDLNVIKTMSHRYATQHFFASAKLWVQKHLRTPYTIMDTDAYLTGPALDPQYDLIASHEEALNKPHVVNHNQTTSHPPVYPSLSTLIKNDTFKVPKVFSETAYPINVGFLHINNAHLHELYINTAWSYIEKHYNAFDHITSFYPAPICFAEQRLLGGLCEGLMMKCKLLTHDLNVATVKHEDSFYGFWMDRKTQKLRFTHVNDVLPFSMGHLKHIWVGKRMMRAHPSFRAIAYHNIMKDFRIICPEHLRLSVVQEIMEKYDSFPQRKALALL